MKKKNPNHFLDKLLNTVIDKVIYLLGLHFSDNNVKIILMCQGFWVQVGTILHSHQNNINYV